MFKIIGAVLFSAIGFYLVLLQQDMRTMEVSIAAQQDEIARLRHTIVTGDTHAALALKISVLNQSTILDMQRRRHVTVTAYSPREKETDASPFYTATNRKVRHGIVAVSRDLFDKGWVFGRKIYIESLGIFTIDDLMARHKRNQIDIFMFDTKKAITFGKKKLKAHLLALDSSKAHKSSVTKTSARM